SRARLLRMLLTESLVLASVSGVLSVWLVYRIPEILLKMFGNAQFNYSRNPDWLVFGYLTGLTVLVGCGTALLPAGESLKVDISASLKGCGSLFGSGVGKQRTRNFLVGAQLAMSLVLLIGAGLFVHAHYKMFDVDPGFDTKHVIVVSPWSKFRTA